MQQRTEQKGKKKQDNHKTNKGCRATSSLLAHYFQT